MRRFALFLIAGLAVSCRTPHDLSSQALTSSAADDSGMEYVEICHPQKDCRKFSRLIMGTDHLAQADWMHEGQPEASDEEIFAVLDEAARLGINFFDTAPIYVGGVENRLGRWLKSRQKDVRSDAFYPDQSLNPDRRVYLLSKGGFPFDLYYAKKLEAGTHSGTLKKALTDAGILSAATKPAADGSIPLQDVPPGTYASRLYGSEGQIKQRVGEELKHTVNNLGSDLTIYLMHRDDGDYLKFNEVTRGQTPVKTIMSALSNKDLSSKYWLIGWSNWQTERVNESIKIAAQQTQLVRPTFNSAYFSLFEMSQRSIHAGGVQVTHDEMMDPNFQKGIKQNPYSPLGGFSIFDKAEPAWENAKLSAKAKNDAGDAYWQNVYHAVFTDANQARYERVKKFTEAFNKEHGTDYTLDQMINAYALAHKRMDFLTIGPVNIEQLRRSVASLKLARMLTERDLEYLYRGN